MAGGSLMELPIKRRGARGDDGEEWKIRWPFSDPKRQRPREAGGAELDAFGQWAQGFRASLIA